MHERAHACIRATVPHYFFDSRDGESFIADDVGLDFETILEARDAATAGLADLARDAIPGRVRRELAIEVRDHTVTGLFGVRSGLRSRRSHPSRRHVPGLRLARPVVRSTDEG